MSFSCGVKKETKTVKHLNTPANYVNTKFASVFLDYFGYVRMWKYSGSQIAIRFRW